MTLVRIERIRYLGIIIKKQLKMEITNFDNWMEKTIEENQKVIDNLSDVGMMKLIQLEETIVGNVRRYKLLVDTPYEIGVNFIEYVCSEKYTEIPMENLYGFSHSFGKEYLKHIDSDMKNITEWVNNIKIGIKNPYSIEGSILSGGMIGNYGKYWRDRLIKEMNKKYDW